MGSMIVENILKLELLFDDEKLIVSNRNIEKIQHLKEEYEELDVEITEDNTELASKCEKIIIAVETPQFKDLLNEIKPFLKENCHIMYTCSGLEFENVEKIHDGKFSMIIPTYASTVSSSNSIASQNRRKGVTLIKHNSKVGFEEQKYIEDLFNEFSYVKKFEEFNMDMENPFNYTSDLNNFSMKNDIEVSTIDESISESPFDFLVTDDIDANDLSNGHMDNLVKKAISLKINPKEAIKMVTLNPAEHYGLNCGEIEIDKVANFALVDNLRDLNVQKVWVHGELVAEDGKTLFTPQSPNLVNIASTVSHDSHNVIVVGTNSQDMADAVNLIRENKGGIAVVSGEDDFKDILELPIAGLMSDRDLEYVSYKLTELQQEAHHLGCTLTSPFMTLSFMSLLVIPSFKISDKGLFDVNKFKFIDLLSDNLFNSF